MTARRGFPARLPASFRAAADAASTPYASERFMAFRIYASVFRRVCLAAALLACACALSSGPAQAAEPAAKTPLQALTLAQQAIDGSDPDAFKRVVDVDSVLSRGLDDSFAGIQKLAAGGEMRGSGAMLALVLVGASDPAKSKAIKQLLASEVKGFVTAGIRGGYFAGKPNGSVPADSGAFSPLLEGLSKSRKEIVPGRVLSQKAGSAVASATFVDHGAGRFPLELALENKEGGWRVVGINNAAALVEEAAKNAR